MPIRYEQGEAAVIGAAQGYGQLQQQNANRDFAVKAFAASQEAGARNQANANQISKINADVNIAELEAQTRNYQTSENAMARVEEQRMQSETAMKLQEGKFNYADNIRLQRLEQGRSWVQQQLSDDQITKPEAAELYASIDGETNVLELRRIQAQRDELQQRARLEGERAAGVQLVNRETSRYALGTMQNIRDNVTGESLGMHQWVNGPNGGEWQPLRPQSGSSAGGGGGNGGGGAGNNVQQYTAISREVDSLLSANNTTLSPEQRARLQDPRGRANEIGRRIREENRVLEELNMENRRARSLKPGGPLPWQPARPVPAGQERPHVEQVQQNIRNQILRAEDSGRTKDSEALRQMADRFEQTGGDTGNMSPQDQAMLVEAGYYRDEFQPEIDRALSFASRPIAAPAGQNLNRNADEWIDSSQGVTERRMIPNPNAPHANTMRELLVASGSRERMSATQRALFDDTRARLGFSEWPPRRPTPQDREDVQTAPGAQPNRPQSYRQPITDEQRSGRQNWRQGAAPPPLPATSPRTVGRYGQR